MLQLIDRHFAKHRQARPWSVALGLARSLIALGALLTLAANSRGDLCPLVDDLQAAGRCTGISGISAFCLMEVEAARLLLLALLAACVAGFAPRFFIIPQWYAHLSIASTIGPAEGGDHISVLVTLLMAPIFLTDRRCWHWQTPKPASEHVTYVASVAFAVLRIQIAILYLHASLGKMAVTEWLDGTATYYWLLDGTFGVAHWLTPLMTAITYNPVGLAFLTWGTIAVEFLLALGLFASGCQRTALLVLGLGLHVAIGIGMGLVAFQLVMVGVVIAYLGTDLTPQWASLRAVLNKRSEPKPALQSARSASILEGADAHA